MKILLVMDPGILVPPKGYGGHERLVYMFAKEYKQMGHEVHLLVTKGSSVEGCIIHDFGIEGFPPKKKDAQKAILYAWKFLWKHRNDFDLIHNFGRLAYLIPLLNSPVKKIMTYGREISARNIRWINKLPNKNLVFTGSSDNLVSRGGVAGKWFTVYNAIDFSAYTLQPDLDDNAPLIFLGRLERSKGCHVAISVAKKSGSTLVIAGNISKLPEEIKYFEEEIAPHIDDKQVVYVGQVDDERKNYYLGRSKALLFPINASEAFGMVMAEAMACGTPVIGFNIYSVTEVIQEGITGFKVDGEDEMQGAIEKIKLIDRTLCRNSARERFDVPVVAKRYLSLFN